MTKVEQVNTALKTHARKAKDWTQAELVRELHRWAVRFIQAFDLKVPTPAICIERLGRRRLGHYRLGRNGFGLYDEIAINAEHAARSPRWRVLGTLLHELFHEWQFVKHGRDAAPCGKHNHHNVEFRDRARAAGLEIDHRGVTEYPAGETPFRKLLARFGVDVADDGAAVTAVRRAGRSKLAMWECGCGVKIRVGRAEIHARCLDCGEDFELQG